jgi:type I restriction enzyme S subunit
MDAQQFLAEFGHIANAPGGVAKLRQLTIQLAISGKLVERIEAEALASLTIQEAIKQRLAYEAELGLRSTRMHPELETVPFVVPDHWEWTRLEQICLYIQRGKGPKYINDSSTHVISQKCIQWSGFDLSSARFVSDDSLDSYGKERFLCQGDLLWNSTGTGTVGRVAVFQSTENIQAVADSHVTVIRLANCSPRYLWCVLASPWVQSRIEPAHPDSLVSGTTQQVELNTSTARGLPIPVPPLEEQARIVAKVDELMALCDRLEQQQQQRRKLQNALRQSILQAVATATSPHELQTTWTRLADNFGQLFSLPEDVDAVREIIYQLAVTGYLVHQDSSEGDAKNLLSEINSIRERLIQERRFKRIMKLESEPLVIPAIDLPLTWQWSRLLSLL